MIFVHTTEKIKRDATLISEERFKFNINSQLRDSRLKSWVLIESIGCQVFKNYLESKSIKYELDFSNETNFIFGFKIQSDFIEVLTSDYESNFDRLNFLYPSNAFKIKQKKLIIVSKYLLTVILNS